MTGAELAKFLGPLVGIRARQDLRALAQGGIIEIALRFDEIKDWEVLGDFLIERADEIQLYDGQEWFTLFLEKADAREPHRNANS
jgi:hypothetical protein